MMRRDCLRLVAIGLLTGPLPACFNAPQQVNRLADDMPAAQPMTQQVFWSPYAMIRTPDGVPIVASARNIGIEKTALPVRPLALPGGASESPTAPPMSAGDESDASPVSAANAVSTNPSAAPESVAAGLARRRAAGPGCATTWTVGRTWPSACCNPTIR